MFYEQLWTSIVSQAIRIVLTQKEFCKWFDVTVPGVDTGVDIGATVYAITKKWALCPNFRLWKRNISDSKIVIDSRGLSIQ